MISLHDIRDLISSLFIMLNEKKYVLFRIEFLVVLVTVMFLAMFIMDIFRRHIKSSIMKAIFSLCDAVSDSIIIYLLGAMQTAPFKNQLFPVWALVLVIFRYSTDFISGYGIPDRGGRRFTEWRNVVKLLGSAFLNWSRGTRFAGPLWSLWALQLMRSWYRLQTRTLALHSVWHGGSSELVSEYMSTKHDANNWKPADCNPETMEGYKYLVYGERVKLQKPRYVLQVNTNKTRRSTQPRRQLPAEGEDTAGSSTITRSSLITLDKIWGCRRHLLHDPSLNLDQSEEKIQGKDLKDLSLAFALSRLLRCRLEDVTLQGDIFQINRKLVMRRIIEEMDAKCAFGVMELQLAFVNDYFNTRYPMVFWNGFFSLYLSLVQSMVTFGVVCWLSVDIRKVYKPPEGELAHLVKGFNIDMFITWVFMFFMMFKEIWEMVTYLLSDWTRVLLVSIYSQWDSESIRNRCMERLMLSFFTSKIIAKRWHGFIDQYVFVESYDDIPTFWNLLHKVTTGIVPKKDNGTKLSNAIQNPECVRQEVLEKIRAITKVPACRALREPDDCTRTSGDRHLHNVITTLSGINSDRKKKYDWAFKLPTSSHVILVWHIATSLCEMELATKNDVDLKDPGFLCSLLHWFTPCCSSKSYLMDVDEKKLAKSRGGHLSKPGFPCSFFPWLKKCSSSKSTGKEKEKLPDKLQERYIIANSLSRYCAYLLVSKPELIPDSFLVPKMVFRQTKRACDVIFKDCDPSLHSRYEKLKKLGEKAAKDFENVKKSENVMEQGAMLGMLLLDDEEGPELHWDILAGVWAELLVHMAPTWNAEAHKKSVDSGGEFITHIWALLWHCGIEKSMLWPKDNASESNASAVPKKDDVGNGNALSVNTKRQASAHMGNDQIGDYEEDEIEEIKETDASNFRRAERGMEATGNSGTEVASQTATSINTSMGGKTPIESEVNKVEDFVPEKHKVT